MTQADVTTAIAWQFTVKATPELAASTKVSRIEALAERLMAYPAYSQTMPD